LDRPTTREHLALVGMALSLPGTKDKDPEVVEAAAGALADYLRRWGLVRPGFGSRPALGNIVINGV
jgi:hypothetical protein